MAGQTFDLTHLSCLVETTVTEHSPNGIRVFCAFSHHCFTVASELPVCDYSLEGEHRNFDVDRYSSSLRLPEIVRTAIRSSRNFMVSVSADKNGAQKHLIVDDGATGQHYHIYFDVVCSTLPYADIKLTVSSAYVKQDQPPRKTIRLGSVFDIALGRVPRRNWKKRKKK